MAKKEKDKSHEKNAAVSGEEQSYDVTTTYEEDVVTTYTVTEIDETIATLEAQIVDWQTLKASLEAL